VLIIIAVLIPMMLLHGRVRAGELGLRRVPSRATLAAAVAYSSYIIVSALVFAVVGAPPARSNATALADTDVAGLLTAYAVIACLLVPITEELLFRGLLYTAFRRRLGPAPAILLAGGLFGALHGPPLGTMLDLALLGITLCALYEHTGSLLPCIAVHAVHNAITYGTVISLAAPATAALTLAAALACLAFTLPLTTTSQRPEMLAGGSAGT